MTLGGQRPVKILLQNTNGFSQEKTFLFAVPPAVLKAELSQAADGAVKAKIGNTGGIHSQCKYSFQLIDNHYNVVHTQNDLQVLIRSGEAVEVEYLLPPGISANLAAGEYYLKLAYQDLGRQVSQECFFVLNLAGLAPALNVSTDKNIYTLTDTITGKADITSNQALSNATLTLKVTSANPAWTNYTNTDGIQQIITDGSYLWFYTNGGIRRYNSQADSWRTWTTADGLGGNRISGLLVNSSEVWASTYDIPYQYWNMRLSKIDKAGGGAVSFPGSGYAGKIIGENGDYALSAEEGGYGCWLFGQRDQQWQRIENLPALWEMQRRENIKHKTKRR